ncbi:hypothetical protein BHE74_00046768 [Ensete ventricosum]|nr:hypothetical protein GW17_00029008 [Ensete ventricosum]RWW47249.1 hypothetical protein BHE74_00046768 [Ensete ventricosum]
MLHARVVTVVGELLLSKKAKSRRGRGRVCRHYRAKSGDEKSNGAGCDLSEPRVQSAKIRSVEKGTSANRVEVATDLRKQRPKEVATNLRWFAVKWEEEDLVTVASVEEGAAEDEKEEEATVVGEGGWGSAGGVAEVNRVQVDNAIVRYKADGGALISRPWVLG